MNTNNKSDSIGNDLNCKKIESIYKKIEDLGGLDNTIKEVKSILGFKKIIAFSGGGQGIKVNFDDKEIAEKIEEYSTLAKKKIVSDIVSRLRDYDIAILTGGTKWDIPKIATEIARGNNIPTIGVYPRRGEKNSVGKDLLNIEVVVDPIYGESHFGDESHLFAKLADGMFVLGGGAGTLIEFAHVMKINEALKKYNGNIKKIVPISGIPGVSDAVHYIPGNDDIKRLTFPDFIINSGKEAFDWMRKELDLDDIMKEYRYIF
ncbi:hypothetical protein CSA08_04730 [Candidatus Gracilibacteria bacterium]|nr:MAG: hypothetical protein CSA08_04730 [Candidatus Gracilibacteria bacterium]